MRRLEYVASALVLRFLAIFLDRLPIRRRVVLATARVPRLEGNLAFIHDAIRRRRRDVPIVVLAEPYGYGLRAKLAYLLRVIRGAWYLRTSSVFVVDNAYLPVHVGPHRGGTTVIQVWHAIGALKRFGADTVGGLAEPERTFLHRYYDAVVASGEAARGPYAAAFRVAPERVYPIGTPRTDLFFDVDALTSARRRVLDAYPGLAGRRVVLYAPTFRGRGRHKRPAPGFDAARLRAALPDDLVLALKSHPNLDPALVPTAGFDVVIDPSAEINDALAATDVLVTDYSSSIFEWALLRRPLVLLTSDLDAYERDPGLYLDLRREAIGVHVSDPDELPGAIVGATVDEPAWTSFITRHLGGCDGHASERFVDRFVEPAFPTRS
jgi:teichoic acid ribitol-phosphate primase